MKRLWAWEKNSNLQNRKRETLWTTAVFCWLAALAVTYWVEHGLYGAVIETNTFSLLGVSIGLAIGSAIRAGREEEVRPLTKKQRGITAGIVAGGLLVLLWGAVKLNLFVYLFQLLFILPVLFWGEWQEKQDVDKISVSACMLLFAAATLAAGTLAAPKVMGYVSTKEAEKMVTAAGFEEAEYLGWLKGAWAYQAAVDRSFYEAEMQEEKYYMLFGRKEGEPYRFLIDPKGGALLLGASEAEEPELGNWYRSREK